MNSPLVVEQAKKLVALPEFAKCEDDKTKITFLYDRIFQRLPRPEEILLGQDFITEKPEPEKVVSADPLAQPVAFDGDARKKFGKQQGKKQIARGGGPGFKQRPPLKAWEEYAHALLQSNEASFVN